MKFFSKKSIFAIVLFAVLITAGFLFYPKNHPEIASDIMTEIGKDYHIETKDGISLDIPKNLQIEIEPVIFSNGYTYYLIVPKGEDYTSENKISFYIFQENTHKNYTCCLGYMGHIYYYGDGAVDLSGVHEGSLRNYKTLEADAKFNYGRFPQFTHYVFDVIPRKGVSVVSFAYTRNSDNPNQDMDKVWESIKNSLYIPDKFLKKTYGDVSLPIVE